MRRANPLLAAVAVILLDTFAVPRADSAPLVSSADSEVLVSRKDWTTDIVHTTGDPLTTSRNPRIGKFVVLAANGEHGVHMQTQLHMRGGTISFWVKPDWAADSTESHTLLSGRWTEDRQSYLVISQGWWEPGGHARLYFVASNEDIVHCSEARKLPVGIWSLVTATWMNGPQGFCKLYVDDELVAETRRSWPGQATLTTVSLGSDEFATNSRGRWAPSELGGLQLIDHPVSHREVIARYIREEDPAAAQEKKWSWLRKEPRESASGTSAPRSAGPFEKVLFDEDMTWAVSPAAIEQRLTRLQNAGFSVYIPCVWHGRGTAFPTDVAAEDSRLRPHMTAKWDPLAYLISRAHDRGISIHLWFTVVRREDQAHPEWAESGTPDGAFDVHQPGFREFAVALMLDAVTRYDADGLNLDYIRAMGVCTSQFCQTDYQTRTGSDLLRDYAGGSPDDASRARIQHWQDDAVGSLVEEVSRRARASKPRIVISIDGHVTPDDAQRPLEGRHEIAWADQGWIDTIYHMDYRPVVDTATVAAAQAAMKHPTQLRLLVANYDLVDEEPVARSGLWVSRVVRYARDRRHDSGIGVYLYSRLSDEQIRDLR